MSLCIIGITIIIIVAIKRINKADCPPPPIPPTIPSDAKWCGGCDGSEWIYLVPNDSAYHFIVFLHPSGDTILNGIFEPEDRTFVVNKKKWRDQIGFYASNDSLLYILASDSVGPCRLICKYPAYGGRDWDIIKEKYKLTKEYQVAP